jgi:hypothetical protein
VLATRLPVFSLADIAGIAAFVLDAAGLGTGGSEIRRVAKG